MVGNALTDDHNDRKGVFQFMWAAGLISDQTFKSLNLECDFQSFVHSSNSCDNVLNIAFEELGDINPNSIFTPTCHSDARQSNQLRKRMHMIGRISQSYDPCTEMHSVAYFNLPEVQQALHVDPNHAPSKWQTCSAVVSEGWKDSAASVLDVHREMIRAGLRIWVFRYPSNTSTSDGTRYNIDSLTLTTIRPWRAWYDGGEVGGWTEEYEGLTFVTVRGAGHEVPLHKPKQLSHSSSPSWPDHQCPVMVSSLSAPLDVDLLMGLMLIVSVF